MTTARAFRFDQIGGPEVLRLESVEVGDPGPGQASRSVSTRRSPTTLKCRSSDGPTSTP